jgi:hypothetical protein
MFLLLFCLVWWCDSSCLDLSLELSVGPGLSELTPAEDGYSERFSTSGMAWGGLVDLRSGSRLGFTVFVETFSKSRAEGSWEGEVDALLIGVAPRLRQSLPLGLEVFAGGGAVYIDGSYEGLDEYDRFVEAEGSSVGVIVTGGLEFPVYGPVTGRLEYRRTFADVKTDRAVFDGAERPLFPAVETDLSSTQLGISLLVSLYGGPESVVSAR